MRKIFALLLPLLLLAGCAMQQEETPLPAPEEPAENSGSGVTVHWDAWMEETEPAAPPVRRWYDEYTDELIPSENYGELIPYIGGESYNYYWGSGIWYGLATVDGVIVTDPVFLNADICDVFDSAESGELRLPVFLLSRVEELPDGSARREFALAAEDGSWCTGMKYRTHIADTAHGILMTEKEGDVVLVGPDGKDVFRWDGDSMPIEHFPTDSEWYIDSLHVLGDYLLYATEWEYEGPRGVYIHLPTGSVYHEPPDDVPSFETWNESAIAFDGGTYYYNGVRVAIETDSGETYEVPLDGYSVYEVADGKIFLGWHRDDGTYSCMVKDFHGNVVMEPCDRRELFTLYQHRLGPMMLYWSEFEGTGGIMDAEGNLLAEPWGYTVKQYGDRIIFMDEEAYRVIDTEGNDILRLPRYIWDD